MGERRGGAHNLTGILERRRATDTDEADWQRDTPAQPGWEPGSTHGRTSRCPARRAALLHLLRLPTLEFSFTPVIKTNHFHTAAGTRLQRRMPAAAGRREGTGSGTPLTLAAFIPLWGTVALQEILDLLPLPPALSLPTLSSPTSSPSLSQLRPPPRALHQLRCTPGCSPSPPYPWPLGQAGAARRAQPTANNIMAVIALRRPRSMLRRRFPGLSGGLMPRGDLFSCHRAR